MTGLHTARLDSPKLKFKPLDPGESWPSDRVGGQTAAITPSAVSISAA